MKFKNLITKYKRFWISYTQHKFVKLIANGKLKNSQFKKYLIQDTIYLKAYGQCWKTLVSFTDNKFLKKYCLENAQTIIKDELTLRNELALDMSNARASKTTNLYIQYMYKLANKQDFKLLFFGLISCFAGYAHMGKYLAKNTTSKKYKKWIDVYTDEKFMKANDEIEKIADGLLEEANYKIKSKIKKIFKKGLILEKDFFAQVL